MTNEQLAILIRGYAVRLDEYIKKLNGDLSNDNEQHLEWMRKDRQPFSPMVAWNAKTDPDFEQVATGDFVCLDDLRQFSGELQAAVDELIR